MPIVPDVRLNPRAEVTLRAAIEKRGENTVSMYEIGVSYWTLAAVGLTGVAVLAALVEQTSRQVKSVLNQRVSELRKHYEHASAAFHEPLSSPSHPSYPPPL